MNHAAGRERKLQRLSGSQPPLVASMKPTSPGLCFSTRFGETGHWTSQKDLFPCGNDSNTTSLQAQEEKNQKHAYFPLQAKWYEEICAGRKRWEFRKKATHVVFSKGHLSFTGAHAGQICFFTFLGGCFLLLLIPFHSWVLKSSILL